ncbi:hypothetical protein C2857_002201 [Epichloe festucae Fl1]|uniref:F-box domain-containing protein n=1 Tax=Epichloe festucae (strain Fl1) TaxID=877507 RepID=A0A7S9KJZ3_EPIFF|nr:hypothetical protein C2857_002201 [Epichloe festucae Fl1]
MAASHRLYACLAGLPVEILLEIYQQLDLQAILKLSITNTEFFQFFQRRKIDILLPVLQRDFSPFDEFLQAYTASAGDIVNSGQYKPRKIAFKRFVGDAGLVLSGEGQNVAASDNGSESRFLQVSKAHKTPKVSRALATTVFLTERDVPGLLKHCRLVREWEELFPQMRWFHQPEDCRLLRAHEQLRFRRALYRWWMYGVQFHGDFPRPQVGHPEPYVDDIRTSQMRYHSTAELLELMDLLETIKDVILHYICPRLDPTPQQFTLVENVSRGHSLATSWNDQSHWGRIIKTYAKLGPEELLYYFNNIYSYPRKRLITEVHLGHPSFTIDQESIQIALRCALDERNWMDKKVNLAEHGVGGIIDFDDERDEDRLRLQSDASPDGRLPNGSRFLASHSRYSPRGDDGSFLDDILRVSDFDSRVSTPVALETLT